MSEAGFIKGRQSAYRSILSSIASELKGQDRDLANAGAELIATRAALVGMCERLGLPTFDQRLWLPDVIEKHIEPEIGRLEEP